MPTSETSPFISPGVTVLARPADIEGLTGTRTRSSWVLRGGPERRSVAGQTRRRNLPDVSPPRAVTGPTSRPTSPFDLDSRPRPPDSGCHILSRRLVAGRRRPTLAGDLVRLSP